MLCVDIETTGLDPRIHTITVAAIYDPEAEIKRVFNFATAENARLLETEFCAALDDADMLCMYNGIRFDIRFIQVRFNVCKQRVRNWILKTADVFEARKQAYNLTAKLDVLLAQQGIECKSGSGLQAIEYARAGQWPELEAYCMQDVILTHELTGRRLNVAPSVSLQYPRTPSCSRDNLFSVDDNGCSTRGIRTWLADDSDKQSVELKRKTMQRIFSRIAPTRDT